MSGYMARDAFPRLAEPLDGPSVRTVQALATEHGTLRIPTLSPEVLLD